MWINLNDAVQLPEKGHGASLTIEDSGKVCQGAKIVGKLCMDEGGRDAGRGL